MSGSRFRVGPRPLGVALSQAGLGLVAFAVVESTLQVAGTVEPTWLILAFPAMALLYGAAGMLAWSRRPRNRTGALIVFGAWTWLAAGLAKVDNEFLVALGQAAATLPFAVIVHLILAFPSGRLPDRISRLTVVGGYLVTTVLEAPLMFVPSSPAEPFLIRPDPALDAAAQVLQGVGALTVVVLSAALVARNLRPAGPAARRAAAPLLGYGIFAVVAVPVSASIVEPLAGIDRSLG